MKIWENFYNFPQSLDLSSGLRWYKWEMHSKFKQINWRKDTTWETYSCGIMLKWFLKKYYAFGLDLSGPVWGPVAGCVEHNKSSFFKTCAIFGPIQWFSVSQDLLYSTEFDYSWWTTWNLCFIAGEINMELECNGRKHLLCWNCTHQKQQIDMYWACVINVFQPLKPKGA
jgi:hypothetical protein